MAAAGRHFDVISADCRPTSYAILFPPFRLTQPIIDNRLSMMGCEASYLFAYSFTSEIEAPLY